MSPNIVWLAGPRYEDGLKRGNCGQSGYPAVITVSIKWITGALLRPVKFRPRKRPLSPNLKERRKVNMAVQTSMASSGLAEVLDRILDKGLVLDAWVRVSLLGLEILTVEARVVIASVETYLKYAEAIGLTATAA
jgi:gas vesicle structural protein